MTGIFKLGDLVEPKEDWLKSGTQIVLADEGMMYKTMYISGYLDGTVRRIFKGTVVYEKVGSVFGGVKDGRKEINR